MGYEVKIHMQKEQKESTALKNILEGSNKSVTVQDVIMLC